jgi:hypothetical protein
VFKSNKKLVQSRSSLLDSSTSQPGGVSRINFVRGIPVVISLRGRLRLLVWWPAAAAQTGGGGGSGKGDSRRIPRESILLRLVSYRHLSPSLPVAAHVVTGGGEGSGKGDSQIAGVHVHSDSQRAGVHLGGGVCDSTSRYPSVRHGERILMSPRGGVNRWICTLIKFHPLSVLKPVRPVSKTGQTGFTHIEPTICESPLRVLTQTKLGVGLPQGFPRVSMKSLHTAQVHQRRSKQKHQIYAK